jgi:hypothetical protein
MTDWKLTKRLEKLLDKYIAPTTYALSLFAIIISLLLIFCPNQFPNVDDRDRVGLSQLSFEAAGVSALILAAREFNKRQRKSKLDLWISEPAPTDKKFDPLKLLANTRTRPSTIEFRFHLVLENYGDSIASWIRINLQLTTQNDSDKSMSLKHVDNNEFWNTARNENKHLHIFNGRSAYQISYHPKGDDGLGERDSIGLFHLNVSHPQGKDLSPQEIVIAFEIHTHEIEEKRSGQLVFRID